MEQSDYQAFRRQYEARHPASVPRRRRVLSDYPRWLQLATLIMFLSSAILSGVHTVPVVRAGIPANIPPQVGDVVSLTAFVSVEMAILLASYAMIGGGGLIVSGVLLLATITALTANIYSVVRAYQATASGGDPGTLAVAVIIGIVAPGIAFLSGKMFVSMGRSDKSAQERADAEYQQACQDWDARIEREWLRYSGRVQPGLRGSVRSDRPPDMSEASVRSASGAASIVREYLRDHPEALSMSVRDLARTLGVGKSTVSSVRAEFVEASGSRPGNNNGTH